ncbi:MAG: hypothetical protein D6806_06470, partial [Deltaproteobacteria bacterium]
PNQLADLTREALGRLVEHKLLLLEARRQGLTVDSAALDRAYSEQVSKLGGRERFLKLLRMSGRTEADFKKWLGEKLLIDRLLARMYSSLSMVTTRRARKWYEQHPDRYTMPPRKHIVHVLCKVDPSDLKESRKRARTCAETVRERLLRGMPVEKAAEGLERVEARDLGWVHRGALMPEIEDAVAKTGDGQVSEPVGTVYGFHVVKVLDTDDGGLLPFDRVVKSIQAELDSKERKESLKALLQECRKRWKVETFLGETGQKG